MKEHKAVFEYVKGCPKKKESILHVSEEHRK